MVLVRQWNRLLNRDSLRRTCSALNYNNQSQPIRQRSETKVVQSPFSDVQIPSCLIDEGVWGNLERWADKDALVSQFYQNKK